MDLSDDISMKFLALKHLWNSFSKQKFEFPIQIIGYSVTYFPPIWPVLDLQIPISSKFDNCLPSVGLSQSPICDLGIYMDIPGLVNVYMGKIHPIFMGKTTISMAMASIAMWVYRRVTWLWKIQPFFMGKSTKMVMFNRELFNYQRVKHIELWSSGTRWLWILMDL